VWVPAGKTVSVCVGTTVIDDLLPEPVRRIKLPAGRHIMEIRVGARRSEIVVDESVLFARAHTKDWNVEYPRLGLKDDFEVTASPTVLFAQRGVATLEPDERYEELRHSFGLLIWLEH
jgi:hypothetical protein